MELVGSKAMQKRPTSDQALNATIEPSILDVVCPTVSGNDCYY